MKRIVVRHGKPVEWAYHLEELGDDPPIADTAKETARLLGQNLRALGLQTDRIASSDTLRARETAKAIGGNGAVITAYRYLDEVPYDLPADQLKRLLEEGKIPEEAITAAEVFLSEPVEEPLIVGHGLFIGGLQAVLALREDRNPVGQNLRLDNLEIRALDF